MTAFFKKEEEKKGQDFHLNILFPFLWQMSINSLAISKYIYIWGEDNFFVFAKNYTDVNQWKNYTVYCSDDIIYFFLVTEKIDIPFILRIIVKHNVVPLSLTGKHLQLV